MIRGDEPPSLPMAPALVAVGTYALLLHAAAPAGPAGDTGAVEAGKKPADKAIYVCQRCGNTVEGEAPDSCPICNAKKSMFKKIE